MIERSSYLRKVQQYLANIGISASALRNQGASGVIKEARTFLGDMDLSILKQIPVAEYGLWLDQITESLKDRFPGDSKHWGAARKAANIVLAYAFMNFDLRNEYNLERLSDSMETPLDSYAAEKLRDWACKTAQVTLPIWQGVSKLERKESDEYQTIAAQYAKAEEMPRACLDVLLWSPALA